MRIELSPCPWLGFWLGVLSRPFAENKTRFLTCFRVRFFVADFILVVKYLILSE